MTWEGYSVYELRPGVWRGVKFGEKIEAKVVVQGASFERAKANCEAHRRNNFKK